ncbi:MAG TPA: hypothetical protein VNL98_06325 [Gemmatimonadales bacterium]|nr:hypothetical protein [Gemmatimonadales bacterium]
MSGTQTWSVESMDAEWAVVLTPAGELRVPRSSLPSGCREGDLLLLRAMPRDQSATWTLVLARQGVVVR